MVALLKVYWSKKIWWKFPWDRNMNAHDCYLTEAQCEYLSLVNWVQWHLWPTSKVTSMSQYFQDYKDFFFFAIGPRSPIGDKWEIVKSRLWNSIVLCMLGIERSRSTVLQIGHCLIAYDNQKLIFFSVAS